MQEGAPPQSQCHSMCVTVRLWFECSSLQKCDLTIPVMSMVGSPSVVRRQKYMTNICDITVALSSIHRRPFLLLPALRVLFAASDRTTTGWLPAARQPCAACQPLLLCSAVPVNRH